MSLDDKKERYRGLMHAMQSGVAHAMELGSDEASPKHLRVGINAAMVNHGALASLLIEKGLITEAEYWDTLIEYAENEVANYETALSKLMGTEVSLL